MSAEIASLEKVRAASAQIRASGGVATADRVIAHLGGGSKGRVLKHLKTLRDSDVKEDAVPQSVLDIAKPAISEIFAAGEKSGADRSAAGFSRLNAAIEELEAQTAELATENALLSQDLASTQNERDQLAENISALEVALSGTESELQALRDELARERGASADKLEDLMKRIDEGVAFMKRNRPTLGLSKHQDRGS